MCSPEASKRGIRPGMKLSEAKAGCAEIIWRELDEKICTEAQTKLVRALVACSPQVMAHHPGVLLLDAQGRQRLGGEGKLCRDILKLASQAGYVNGQVGIADSAFAALVATRFPKRRWFVVNPGEDVKFLSDLPIDHLPISQDLHGLFLDLGLQTMRQLSQLPADQIIDRFGAEGKSAHELASGLDLSWPQIPVLEKQRYCMVDLGGPIEALNQTIFVVKSMLDKLTSDLKQEGLHAEELTVSFFNDEEMFDERPLRLIRSSNNAKFLVEVVRLSLEAQPLKRQFTGIKIAISRSSQELWEQPSIARLAQDNEQGGMQPESLNLLLQRFITRLGEDALVVPLANDQYLPEKAGFWQAVGNRSEPSASIEVDYIKALVGEEGLVSNLVLKSNISPVPVLIEFNDGKPAVVRYRGRWHYIKQLTTAECISGGWWDKPVRRTYFRVLIDARPEPLEALEEMLRPALLSLCYEHDAKTWFVDGVYD